MESELKFYYIGEHMPDCLVPAKSMIPDWYKEIPAVNTKTLTFTPDNYKVPSLKNCVPFFDAISGGYIFTLWQDIFVSENPDGTKRVHWYGDPEPVSVRSNTIGSMPPPVGYEDLNLGFRNPLMMKGPKGTSVLFTQPFGRLDSPMFVPSAIVDIDVLCSPGVVTLFFREDFTGLIPAGTPVYQLIPFKRSSWKAVKDESLLEENNKQYVEKRRKLLQWYRSNAWFKKEYN
jgi:hypothetical protein